MKLLKNLRNFALSMSAASACIAPTAYAAGATSVDSDKLLSQFVNIVIQLARYIGIILLVWGVVMLVLAFKNEDADSKSRAIMLIAVAVVLVAMGTFLGPIFSAIGFTYTST